MRGFIPRDTVYPQRVGGGELAGDRTQPLGHEVPALFVEEDHPLERVNVRFMDSDPMSRFQIHFDEP